MPIWNPQANAIFMNALEIDSADDRQTFIERSCADDAELRSQVISLLQAIGRAGNFLESVPHRNGHSRICPFVEKCGDAIGPYELVEEIGEGGMGVVYRAHQAKPIRRFVALKVIKPGMDSRAIITRFEAERQAIALMDHPHIAKVLDAGSTTAGRPYFVLELVKGAPITEYCDSCQLTTGERLELFCQVCRAISHAHERGIVHRDIKPSNVLVTMQDGRQAPKVIDFGVAKALGYRLTEQTLTTTFTQMLGTPRYMSPEQAELSGMDVDTRSDVYSLGVLLYELVSGTTPLEPERIKAVDLDGLRHMIREEDPPRPSTRLSTIGNLASTIAERRRTEPHRLCRRLRGDLDWIVMKAIEKDRGRRYQSVDEFAADVQRYLENRPVVARRPTVVGRAVRWSRRHIGLVLSTAIVLLISTIALSVSTTLILSSYRRESLARTSELKSRSAEAAALSRATSNLQEAQCHALDARRTSYASDMRFAFQQWNQFMLRDTRELLDAQIPREGAHDLRGLEWHLLNSMVLARMKTLGQHQGLVSDIDLFPDGRTIATAGEDGSVRLWDTETASLARTFQLQRTPIYTVGVLELPRNRRRSTKSE